MANEKKDTNATRVILHNGAEGSTDKIARDGYLHNTIQINNPSGVLVGVYTSIDGEGDIGGSNWVLQPDAVEYSAAGTHQLVLFGKVGYLGATIAAGGSVKIQVLSGGRESL
jgi:hypothetical protein